MKNLFIFFCLFLPLSIFASTKVVIIGDSISLGGGATAGNGYPDLLAKRYEEEGKDIVLINRSFAGARTDTLQIIGVNVITTDRPDYIVILLGINDATINTPQEALLNNFVSFVSKATGNCKRIILGGVETFTVNPNYKWALSNVYDHLIKKYNVYPVDLLDEEIMKTARDRLHPNNEGHQKIADLLYDALHEAAAY
jgi:acyl-CoA thioesterase-1